jgi:hypothetical protein
MFTSQKMRKEDAQISSLHDHSRIEEDIPTVGARPTTLAIPQRGASDVLPATNGCLKSTALQPVCMWGFVFTSAWTAETGILLPNGCLPGY